LRATRGSPIHGWLTGSVAIREVGKQPVACREAINGFVADHRVHQSAPKRTKAHPQQHGRRGGSWITDLERNRHLTPALVFATKDIDPPRISTPAITLLGHD